MFLTHTYVARSYVRITALYVERRVSYGMVGVPNAPESLGSPFMIDLRSTVGRAALPAIDRPTRTPRLGVEGRMLSRTRQGTRDDCTALQAGQRRCAIGLQGGCARMRRSGAGNTPAMEGYPPPDSRYARHGVKLGYTFPYVKRRAAVSDKSVKVIEENNA